MSFAEKEKSDFYSKHIPIVLSIETICVQIHRNIENVFGAISNDIDIYTELKTLVLMLQFQAHILCRTHTCRQHF